MGSVLVVTGGNRGIGRAVCERLADDGHRVLLVARDAERGRQAAAGIRGDVEFVAGDLATTASVRRLAEELRARCPRVDVLVHNAGLWPGRRVLTSDGVEESFAVNRTSAGADFSSLRTYADTKLCNLLTVPLFAERWREAGVTIDAVHPGVIRTGLGDRGGPAGWLLKAVKRKWATVEEGAGPVVALAGGTGTGRYFDQLEEVPLRGPALDGELARRVWDEAEALTATR
ncbi:SDR family oxidoreductase [Nonomuraea monospora]|uniref:SDR family oxidoreductase n=1 Tax=Nonomuraea monospora TaxID=568818 RepID=A0ABN3CVY1_9ACTN